MRRPRPKRLSRKATASTCCKCTNVISNSRREKTAPSRRIMRRRAEDCRRCLSRGSWQYRHRGCRRQCGFITRPALEFGNCRSEQNSRWYRMHRGACGYPMPMHGFIKINNRQEAGVLKSSSHERHDPRLFSCARKSAPQSCENRRFGWRSQATKDHRPSLQECKNSNNSDTEPDPYLWPPSRGA